MRKKIKTIKLSKALEKITKEIFKDWGNDKPTRRQKKIFEVLQNFGVVGREYKHHSSLVESLEDLIK